jgi:hypothetical protein
MLLLSRHATRYFASWQILCSSKKEAEKNMLKKRSVAESQGD